jgi:methylmalonyl-CoA/ethylmalonyl-CoA epimerase
MSASGLGTNVVTQVCVVVKDCEKSAKAYAELFGVEAPKPFLSGPLEDAHTLYRGKPTDARARMAFFHLGQVDLELIEPTGGPSTWREHLEKHGESVHHIAFKVPSMKQALSFLNGQGMPTVQTGDFGSGCYGYVDSAPKLGVILELLEIYAKKV